MRQMTQFVMLGIAGCGMLASVAARQPPPDTGSDIIVKETSSAAARSGSMDRSKWLKKGDV